MQCGHPIHINRSHLLALHCASRRIAHRVPRPVWMGPYQHDWRMHQQQSEKFWRKPNKGEEIVPAALQHCQALGAKDVFERPASASFGWEKATQWGTKDPKTKCSCNPNDFPFNKGQVERTLGYLQIRWILNQAWSLTQNLLHIFFSSWPGILISFFVLNGIHLYISRKCFSQFRRGWRGSSCRTSLVLDRGLGAH